MNKICLNIHQGEKLFIEYPELDSPNTYAIVDGSMKEEIRRWRGNVVAYSFQAYWIVRKGATKGSLAYGTLTTEFNNDYAKELNNRDNYDNLGIEDVLGFSDNLPGRVVEHYRNQLPKFVKSYATAIFGNGNVWSGGAADEDFKNLVDSWFNLPELPENASRVVKLVKS